MVSSGFRPPHSSSGSPGAKHLLPSPAGCHVRSISLPSSKLHPVLSDIHDAMDSLASWKVQFNHSPAWLCAGLVQLQLLHDSLDDLLRLPNSHDALARSGNCAIEKLLEHFLRVADAFGTFRTVLVSMKQYISEAQAAMRRGDTTRMASCMRLINKTEKELAKMASALQKPALASHQSEIVGDINEVMRVTISASTSVFMGIVALSSSASKPSFAALRSGYVVAVLKRNCSSSLEKKEEWRQGSLEELEECVVALESRAERVLRRLVNTRVSLLNIMTPSM